MTSSGAVATGDRVVLVEPDTGRVHLVQLDGRGPRQQRGLGVMDPQRLAGLAFGSEAQVGAKHVVVLRPALPDLAATLQRKAQIITPKDASRIVYELGLAPGDRAFESGIGSAAATMALAWAVGDEGRVVVQELREEFAALGLDNLRRAGLAERVEIHVGDATAGLATAARGPFAGVLLDLPEPWRVLSHVVAELAPGARVACYTPQVSQVEQSWNALQALGFADVRALELIERQWEVKARGSRPSFDGLGHTGFLVLARWLGAPHFKPAD